MGYRSEYDGLRSSMDELSRQDGPRQPKESRGRRRSSAGSQSNMNGGSSYSINNSRSTTSGSRDGNLLSKVKKLSTNTSLKALDSAEDPSTPSAQPYSDEPSVAAPYETNASSNSSPPTKEAPYVSDYDESGSNPWADVPGKVHYHQTISSTIDTMPRTDSTTFPNSQSGTPSTQRRKLPRPPPHGADAIPPGLEREAQAILIPDGTVRETKELRERWTKERLAVDSAESVVGGGGGGGGTSGRPERTKETDGHARIQAPSSTCKPPSSKNATEDPWRVEDDPWRT